MKISYDYWSLVGHVPFHCGCNFEEKELSDGSIKVSAAFEGNVVNKHLRMFYRT